MTKEEAIKKMVEEFSSLSTDQLKILAEARGEYLGLPMWGTMWRMDYHGEELYENSRIMLGGIDELKDEIGQDKNSNYSEKERKILAKAIKEDDWSVLGDYIDEEMSGERCVLDKDDNTTAMFIYELDGEYWLGVDGAGWSFYDGVWDKLYDIIGLKWHDEA
jgi:hypothetical protein